VVETRPAVASIKKGDRVMVPVRVRCGPDAFWWFQRQEDSSMKVILDLTGK